MQKIYRYSFQIACLLFIAIGICLHFVMFHHPFEYDELFGEYLANYKAQGEQLAFDLVVHAVQVTENPNP